MQIALEQTETRQDDSSFPTVAVVVLCFNQAPYVRQCLDSVLSQDALTQLIIVDDASTDESPDVIQGWVAERGIPAQVILHPVNTGVCASGNDGARLVSATYMAIVAADDYWLPGKLHRQRDILEEAPSSYCLTYSDALLCDESGASMDGMFIERHGRDMSARRPSGWVFNELLRGNFIPAPTVLMRVESFREAGGFDESLLFDDFDLWLRLAQRFQFWYDDVPLTVYRVQPNSMMRTMWFALLSDTLKIYRRYSGFADPSGRLARAALGRGHYEMYSAGGPAGAGDLWVSLRLSPSWQAALLLPLALSGVDGRRYKLLRGWLKTRFPRLRTVGVRLRLIAP